MISVIGAGSIGVAFAVVFASAGHTVRLHDPFPESLGRAHVDLDARLGLLDRHGLLDEPVSEILDRVEFHDVLEDALVDATLVQECAPERLDVKRELFRRIAAAANADAVLASSSSAIVPSHIAEGLDAGDRIIVGHPGNPPYLLPVVEVVPGDQTAPHIVETVSHMYESAGLRPVHVRREVEGFVFNRLQGALLREAYCLVRDGVVSVADLDAIVRDGLGKRWSVIGPFETVDLNTRGGIASHAEKMGPAYARMGAERGQHDTWSTELVTEVERQRRTELPIDEWEARVQWRDEQLMRRRSAERQPDTSPPR